MNHPDGKACRCTECREWKKNQSSRNKRSPSPQRDITPRDDRDFPQDESIRDATPRENKIFFTSEESMIDDEPFPAERSFPDEKSFEYEKDKSIRDKSFREEKLKSFRKDTSMIEDITSEDVIIDTSEINGDYSKIVPKALYNYGEHGCGFASKGPPQDFYKLREKHFREKTLFVDPEFGKNMMLFGHIHGLDVGQLKWLRPTELCKKPKMFCDGFSRFDLTSGPQINCYLHAAIALLTMADHQFIEIVPLDQSFDKNYAGIFHFRLWHFGRWIDTVVDDTLPVVNGKLLCVQSTDNNEFWGALLEKAYAKLYGGYGSISAGKAADAMQDLTGGVTETLSIQDPKEKVDPKKVGFIPLIKIILQCQERGSFMVAIAKDVQNHEKNLIAWLQKYGISPGRCYSITNARYMRLKSVVKDKTGEVVQEDKWVFLVRLRSPLGGTFEYKGPFSDGDTNNWNLVEPKSQMNEVQLTFKADGEFWMNIPSFGQFFSFVSICHMTADTMSDIFVNDKANKKWNTAMYEGEWVKNASAGGSTEIEINPQLVLELDEPEEEPSDKEEKEPDAPPEKPLNRILVELIVKCGDRYLFADKVPKTGFSIWLLNDKDVKTRPLTADFFKNNAAVFNSELTIERSNAVRVGLPAGKFVIVPYTELPNQAAPFILRVFTPKQSNLVEHDEAFAIDDDFNEADFVNQFNPDPEETVNAYKEYEKLAAGEEIRWQQLRTCLNSILASSGREFSKPLCQSMMALMDYDNSGKISFDEFKNLWNHIRVWKEVFKVYDHKNVGSIDGHTVKEAFKRAGYKLSTKLLNCIMKRFGDEEGRVTFDDFLMCAVKLLELQEKFTQMSEGKPTVSLTMKKWMSEIVYT